MGRSQSFNPRGPGGPRPDRACYLGGLQRVSIHAARVGRDGLLWRLKKGAITVSIHAARVGRDNETNGGLSSKICFNPRGPGGPRRENAQFVANGLFCFNPRGPGGPRHGYASILNTSLWFQSTRPGWAATHRQEIEQGIEVVSIHAARVGRDHQLGQRAASSKVSIHAARVGRDGGPFSPPPLCCCFNPRGPGGPRHSMFRTK